jgi:hypothetical protein
MLLKRRKVGLNIQEFHYALRLLREIQNKPKKTKKDFNLETLFRMMKKEKFPKNTIKWKLQKR